MPSASSAAPRTSSSATGHSTRDRKSTRLNSSHTVIYALSLHDALPICELQRLRLKYAKMETDAFCFFRGTAHLFFRDWPLDTRSEEHTSELQSHSDLRPFPTRRSSDLRAAAAPAEIREDGDRCLLLLPRHRAPLLPRLATRH